MAMMRVTQCSTCPATFKRGDHVYVLRRAQMISDKGCETVWGKAPVAYLCAACMKKTLNLNQQGETPCQEQSAD